MDFVAITLFTRQLFPLFIFLPTPSDTWDYCFRSNLSLLTYIKLLLIKEAYIVLQPCKHEEATFLIRLFFRLSRILLMKYCKKNVAKLGGWEKDIDKEGIKGRWPYRRVVYRRGIQTFYTLWTLLAFIESCRRWWNTSLFLTSSSSALPKKLIFCWKKVNLLP